MKKSGDMIRDHASTHSISIISLTPIQVSNLIKLRPNYIVFLTFDI